MSTKTELKNIFVSGHKPTESEFDDLIDSQINISDDLVNDLTTGGALKALTAEQGKTLKDSVVNDLTTGGTAVPLSAEQGKTLNTNKIETSVLENTPTDSTAKVTTSKWLYDNILTGWTADTDTWVYVAANQFKVVGKDVTAKFGKGTRLKFTQTTIKYGVVIASAFSTDTTVTILTNTDYTVANATITLPNYSYQISPQNYPGWFAITAPTWNVAEIDNGSGGQPTTTEYRGCVNGKVFTAHILGTGTKAGTNWYFSFTNNGPARSGTSDSATIGPCNVGWSGVDHNGATRLFSAVVYFTFDSDRTIADNQGITVFSSTYSYEI